MSDDARAGHHPLHGRLQDSRARRICDGVTAAVLVAAALAMAGCGSRQPESATVRLEGSVTVNGLAVPSGSIMFVSEGGGQAASGTIRDGRYLAELVPLGPVRVLFWAVRETGKMLDEDGRRFPERVSMIPRDRSDGIPISIDGDMRRQDFAL